MTTRRPPTHRRTLLGEGAGAEVGGGRHCSRSCPSAIQLKRDKRSRTSRWPRVSRSSPGSARSLWRVKCERGAVGWALCYRGGENAELRTRAGKKGASLWGDNRGKFELTLAKWLERLAPTAASSLLPDGVYTVEKRRHTNL